MKQKILAAIGAAMLLAAIGLTGCSGEDSTASSAASAVSSEASAVESTASAVPSSPSSEAVESTASDSERDAEFEEKFAQNPIDEAYDQQINNATTSQEILSIANTYAGLWSAEISHAYEELLQKQTCGLGLTEVEEDQKQWEQEKDSKIEEIRESVAGDGSTVQMEQAIKIKDFYRDKAKEVYRSLYNCDPDYDYIYTPY